MIEPGQSRTRWHLLKQSTETTPQSFKLTWSRNPNGPPPRPERQPQQPHAPARLDLSRLTPRQKEAFRLREAGWTRRQIAESMGIRSSGVKILLERANQALVVRE